MSVFLTANDDIVGTYEDIRAQVQRAQATYADMGEPDNAEYMAELLTDLENYKTSEGLLILSDNGGMGYTIIIKELTGGEE